MKESCVFVKRFIDSSLPEINSENSIIDLNRENAVLFYSVHQENGQH